jgi:hypothetical protein
MIYKLLHDPLSNKDYGAFKVNENGSVVSFLFDDSNTEYQEYLKWIKDGNVPLEADI